MVDCDLLFVLILGRSKENLLSLPHLKVVLDPAPYECIAGFG